ncbi:MAG: SLATT domain-containing protein [Firmicutes bacterium]|nr:SLATT domain-containing protein [Bacillota bacterium]
MQKSDLKTRITTTRKAHINAELRLLRTNNFVKFINIYYAVWLATLSIYSVLNPSVYLSVILAIYSVALTIAIIFLSTKNYGERALAFKTSYLALGRLANKFPDTLTDSQSRKLNEDYVKLLSECENHLPIDYYSAMIEIERRDKLDKKNKSKENSGELEFTTARLTSAQRFAAHFRCAYMHLGAAFLLILPIFTRCLVPMLTWITSV